MAKIGSLAINGINVYPRTIGNAVALTDDGVLLPEKLDDFSSSINLLQKNLSGLTVEDDADIMNEEFYNKMDVDTLLLKLKNELTIKITDIGETEPITNAEINSLFTL